jgi:hypothetical protein
LKYCMEIEGELSIFPFTFVKGMENVIAIVTMCMAMSMTIFFEEPDCGRWWNCRTIICPSIVIFWV